MGWKPLDKKIAWIKWETLCKTKEEGGLGIRDIENFNKALLEKWKWRLVVEKQGKRKEVLDWWCDLRSVCGNSQLGTWFDKCLEWRVGEGNKVLFWEDKCVGGSSLFPRMYAISNYKGRFVEELGGREHNIWDLNLTCNL